MGCRFMYQIESKMTFLFMSLFFLSVFTYTHTDICQFVKWIIKRFPFSAKWLEKYFFTSALSCRMINGHEDILSLLRFSPPSWVSWCWKLFKIRFFTLHWSFLWMIIAKEAKTYKLNKIKTYGYFHLDFHFHIWNDTAKGRNAIHVAVADWPYFGLISSLSIVLRG